MPYVPDLGLLLTAGYRVEHDGIVYVVEARELGPVVLPTGRVVGCDPLVAQVTRSLMRWRRVGAHADPGSGFATS